MRGINKVPTGITCHEATRVDHTSHWGFFGQKPKKKFNLNNFLLIIPT
jgi:hypothetical protein